ncbi:kinase [Hirsutella rhossiliensis]|uniref:EKC/KEOPS complex subunit BUD32 n=1 Tax=Hirsutella rhossiliensis TaxID=111463 RepID=A0A9P8N713_9HYPO|nr:kinase [Hirsutella rhossiliensis]KAH0968130.1 kinase [Hirsutella rhossiliensis]
MTLSKQQISIILKNPLNDTLDRSRVKLRGCDETDQAWRDEIANLLSALVGSTAAFNLPVPDGSGDVAVKLFSIQRLVRGGSVKLDQFRSLVCFVVDNAPDVDIWDAVFSLIDTLSTLTPPPSSIAPTYKGTPVKTSSSRLADSETRDIVEGELFFEIKDCTFRNVGGFCDKFFDSKSWRKEQKEMLKRMMVAHDGKKWTNFRPLPMKNRSGHGSERKGQMDLFFQTTDRETNSTFTYKDVLVVGEQKKSYDTSRFKADILQLARYVRGVFADQPTRRFVHAFSLCSSKMELWVFDRSGLYSSGSFDIHDEPDKFAQALVGYATMSDDAMGLDAFIDREEGHRYAILEDASGNETRIRLEELIVRQRAIVCRGTTCYRTRNGHVAKFSWASDKRKPEVDHLKLAGVKGVKGVARVVAHRQITTIADMRKGLEFPKSHRFRDDDVHFRDLPSARPPSKSQKPKLAKEFKEQLSIGKSKPSLYTSTSEDPFENRIYSCLVVSPAGRVISDFKSIRELLESLRDAIRAHQSLYIDGNILHRDISSNNIIITGSKTADGFKGMLIDLDLAKVRDSGPSGARHQTGTMQFMAIEVLRKVDHTYRHDLESFFYVLLWICARDSWMNRFGGEEEPPRKSLLRKWEIGSFSDIADAKEGHMTVNSLERIMGEFPERLDIVKPLCLRIRSIMFGDTARLNFGTPIGDSDQLYKPLVAAYDDAISEL